MDSWTTISHSTSQYRGDHKETHNLTQRSDSPSTVVEQPEVIADLTIFYENQPIMTINRSDLSIPLQDFPLADTVKLQNVMDQLDQTIRKEPINATLGQLWTNYS